MHTGDFGDKNTPVLNTTDFAAAIIYNFGKIPRHMAKPILPNMPVTQTAFKLSRNEMMVTEETQKEAIVGVDFFIESSEQPEKIARKCQRHGGVRFNLINISNRGTRVWPTGSPTSRFLAPLGHFGTKLERERCFIGRRIDRTSIP